MRSVARWQYEPRSSGKGGWAAAALVLVSLGCAAAEPVRVTDECVPLSEPVRLRETAGSPGRWSIGLVHGQVLFAYVTREDDRPATMRAQWFDESFAATTEDFWMGDSWAAVPFEWAAHEGRLWAQIWAEPSTTPLDAPVGVWALGPGDVDAMRTEMAFPIALPQAITIGAPSVSAGSDARAPVIVADGRPVFALIGVPRGCPGAPVQNYARLMLFDPGRVVESAAGTDPCAVDGSVWAHNPRLVRLRDRGLGVFFRLGISVGQGYLHYSRVAPDLTLLDVPPRRVDDITVAQSTPGGYQPRAVALGDGTLLYTLRDPRPSINTCQVLMLVNPDGTGAREAPFQMSCRTTDQFRSIHEPVRAAPTMSEWVILTPLSMGHAVIAYGERTNFTYLGNEYTRLTASRRWEEGVFLHTIDEEGRRASEIVRVSAPESTALENPTAPRTEFTGPFPHDFEVQAVSEGDEVVVAWRDNRPDAPGYYARRFRCTALPE